MYCLYFWNGGLGTCDDLGWLRNLLVDSIDRSRLTCAHATGRTQLCSVCIMYSRIDGGGRRASRVVKDFEIQPENQQAGTFCLTQLTKAVITRQTQNQRMRKQTPFFGWEELQSHMAISVNRRRGEALEPQSQVLQWYFHDQFLTLKHIKIICFVVQKRKFSRHSLWFNDCA